MKTTMRDNHRPPTSREERRATAVDWIFSSRIQLVGLEPISGYISVLGGTGRFLTLGGSLGEQVVFMKTRFCSTTKRK